MIHYILLPVLLLITVIVQTTILDLFTFGLFSMEISLIIAIYAGFHLDVLRGGLLSLALGFFLDCLAGAIFGLYTFLYLLVFFLAQIVADRVYREKPALVASFTAVCTLLEGLAIVFFYRSFFGADILSAIPKIFIPQAVVMGLLSPLFFKLFHRFGVFLHAEDTQPAQRI